MTSIETVIYEVSKIFLTPVLLVLLVMFAASLFYFGVLLVEGGIRLLGWRGARPLARFAARGATRSHGAPLAQEALELRVLRLIEPMRVISRVAPMLGLVATMIPMGPALVSVSLGNAQGIASSLVVAFSAVIIALLAAAIAFTVLTVRRACHEGGRTCGIVGP